jgi:hypothetical protein
MVGRQLGRSYTDPHDRAPCARCCVSSSRTCNVRATSDYRKAPDMRARGTGQRQTFERSPGTVVLIPHYHVAARRPSLHAATLCQLPLQICNSLQWCRRSMLASVDWALVAPARSMNPSLARELGFLMFGQFILSHPAAAVTADWCCGVS